MFTSIRQASLCLLATLVATAVNGESLQSTSWGIIVEDAECKKAVDADTLAQIAASELDSYFAEPQFFAIDDGHKISVSFDETKPNAFGGHQRGLQNCSYSHCVNNVASCVLAGCPGWGGRRNLRAPETEADRELLAEFTTNEAKDLKTKVNREFEAYRKTLSECKDALIEFGIEMDVIF